jgi:uncharacterized membrane protein
MNRSAGLVAKCAALVALGLCPMLLHVTLAAGGGTPGASAPGMARFVDGSLVAASAVPHTLIYLALFATFGITLLPRRDPFITALARKMYGAVSDEMAVYTRGVTWAWTCFFAAQPAISLLLYLSAPVYVWSLFVNVLNLPLVALMFAAEHAYRTTHLRDAPHHSLADIKRMAGYIKDIILKQASAG